MRHVMKTRRPAMMLATVAKAPVSHGMSADVKLQAALDRISVLERQVSMLLDVIYISGTGDVHIACGGTLTLDGAQGTRARSDVEVVLSGPSNSVSLSLGEIAVESTTRVRLAGATVQADAGRVQVNSGMLQSTGTMKCETIIANSVVGTSYTPGAGNVW